MILYYLILGVALCMSIATWTLIRHVRKLDACVEFWRVRFEKAGDYAATMREQYRKASQAVGAGRRAMELRYREFEAQRRENDVQRVEIAELQQQLQQHQAAAGYRKSGESVKPAKCPTCTTVSQAPAVPVKLACRCGRRAPKELQGVASSFTCSDCLGEPTPPCKHPVEAVMWNPGNQAYQCHCCGTQLYLHEESGRYSFSETEPEPWWRALAELFSTPGGQKFTENLFGSLQEPKPEETGPWA